MSEPNLDRPLIEDPSNDSDAVDFIRDFKDDVLSAEQAKERSAAKWHEAKDRLDNLIKPVDRISGEVDLAKYALSLYGLGTGDTNKLSFPEMSSLAASHISHDMLVIQFYNSDGTRSSYASSYYPTANPDDYKYIGVAMPHARAKLKLRLKPEPENDNENKGGTKVDSRYDEEIIPRYARQFDRQTPAIIAIPGRIRLDYDHLTIESPSDFLPPYGGSSEHVTLFEPI